MTPHPPENRALENGIRSDDHRQQGGRRRPLGFQVPKEDEEIAGRTSRGSTGPEKVHCRGQHPNEVFGVFARPDQAEIGGSGGRRQRVGPRNSDRATFRVEAEDHGM